MQQRIKNFIKTNLFTIIIIIFIIVDIFVVLPYSVYTPGGTINLCERIEGSNYNCKNEIRSTYVKALNGNISNLLLALIIPSWDIIPNEEITLDNEDIDTTIMRDKIYLQEAISSATYVAYQNANIPVKISKEHLYLMYFTEEADTDLLIGDEIIAIDNHEVLTADDISDYINSIDNDQVTIEVLRNGKSYSASAKIYESEGIRRIGIIALNIYEYDNQPNLSYYTKNRESGSSGGLMLSLAMYNALIEEDITNNHIICGTGVIDYEGNVDSIAGVKYKLAGAVKDHCDIFLVPSDNYQEADAVIKERNYSIKLIEAINFKQVLEELKKTL